MKKLLLLSSLIMNFAFCSQQTGIELDPTSQLNDIIESVQPKAATTSTRPLTENLIEKKSCFSRLKEKWKGAERPMLLCGICCLLSSAALIAGAGLALLSAPPQGQSLCQPRYCVENNTNLSHDYWMVSVLDCGKCNYPTGSGLACPAPLLSQSPLRAVQEMTKKKCPTSKMCLNTYSLRCMSDLERNRCKNETSALQETQKSVDWCTNE